MGTTSTGYNPTMIVRQQPTSSGQIMTFSSGCVADFEADTLLDMKANSTMRLRSGAKIRRAVTAHTSATTSITALDGHKTIGSTIANTFKLSQPNPGDELTISVVGTSFVQTFRGSTAKVTRFGSTALKKYSMVVAPTSKSKSQGVHVRLVALSSASWAPLVGYTTSNQVTFTSAS